MAGPVSGGGSDAAGQALLDIAIQELALVLVRNPQEEQLEKQRKEERDRLEGKD